MMNKELLIQAYEDCLARLNYNILSEKKVTKLQIMLLDNKGNIVKSDEKSKKNFLLFRDERLSNEVVKLINLTTSSIKKTYLHKEILCSAIKKKMEK